MCRRKSVDTGHGIYIPRSLKFVRKVVEFEISKHTCFRESVIGSNSIDKQDHHMLLVEQSKHHANVSNLKLNCVKCITVNITVVYLLPVALAPMHMLV